MKTLLMRSAISAVLLAGGLTAGAAFAEDMSNHPTATRPAQPGDSLGRAVDQAGRTIDQGARDVSKSVDNAMNAVDDEANSQALPDRTLASNIIGEKVLDQANNTAGTVDDILISADGRIVAYKVAFGSVLGMGGDPVMVQPSDLTVTADQKSGEKTEDVDDYNIRLNASADQLKTKTQPTASADMHLYSAKDLNSADVTVAGNDQRTSIKDLILSRSNRVSQVLLSTGGVAGVGATQRVMPIASLQLTPDGDNIKAQLDNQSLMSAPEIKG